MFQRFLLFLFCFLFFLPPAFSRSENRWGIMTGKGKFVTQEALQAVKQTGAQYFRPLYAVVISDWLGSCPDCEEFYGSRLKIILTVRQSGGGPRDPSSPPKTYQEFQLYQKRMRDILRQYKPEIVAVENEESSAQFFAGTADEYAVELAAACETAHAGGISCTNGGMAGSALALLRWHAYIEAGDTEEACKFAQGALYIIDRKMEGKSFCQVRSPEDIPRNTLERIHDLQDFLRVYRFSAIDYVNFHWYARDPKALKDAVQWLKERTGKKAMTNEIGQKNFEANAAYIEPLMQAVEELGLAYAVWSTVDTGEAYGLFNPDLSLRPTGAAFQKYLFDHYPHLD